VNAPNKPNQVGHGNFDYKRFPRRKNRHQDSWKTGGLFHLKSRIVLTTGNTPRTKQVKVMNRIGTQVLMANGISRRRFLVDSAGIAAGAGLSLAMKGTDTNQSGLAPAEITNQAKTQKEI
jgi:hypothetical protein